MRQPSVIARRVAAASVSLVVAAGAAACGPEDSDAKGSGGDSAPHKGGTLTVLNSQPQTDFDPARLYTSGGGNVPSLVFRTLTTRNRENGEAGAKVVPDLATDTGRPNKDATVWTYTLKKGLKYEDGTPITSADIKYGIERSFAPELSGGAPYLRDWLVGAADYQGPYKDKKGLSAIETPDSRTIVFHLNKPEGEFPYLATQTQFTPVPKSKDTGTKYEAHPVSSGPYKVVKNENDGEHLVLERNPHWSAATDAERKAYPDTIDVRSGLDSSVINQRLSASPGCGRRGRHHGHQPRPGRTRQGDRRQEAGRARGHRSLRLHQLPRVQPEGEALRQPQGAPGRRLRHRPLLRGQRGRRQRPRRARHHLPAEPESFGHTPYDPFPAGASGNPAKAKELLAQAGYKNGLSITLTHSNEKDFETSPEIATAVQDALKKAGITVKLQGLEDNDYRDKIHSVQDEPGLFLAHWGADWPSGGPFLAPIFDGRQIVKDGANFNTGQLNDKSVNDEIDAINKLTDLDAAAQRWGALDKKIGDKALVVPLFHPVYKRLYGSAVKNVVISDWTGVLDVSQVAVK